MRCGAAMVRVKGCYSVLLFFAYILLILTVTPAQAYTDPGSGLLLWQLIVSGFVGCIVFRFRKIFHFIFKRNQKQKEQ
jgi:hypothetical protein